MRNVNATPVNVRANAPAPLPVASAKPITVEMPAVVGQIANVTKNTKQDFAKLGELISQSKYLGIIGKIVIMIVWAVGFMIYGYNLYVNEEKKSKDRNSVNMAFGIIYMILALLWPFTTILLEFFA